jgi:hypothetical protein
VHPEIDEVWSRIESHAGERFELLRGGSFSYEVNGAHLLPVGRARSLSKTNFANGLSRVPLDNTTSVRDLQGPSYVYAILMDRRIRRGDW